MPRKIEPLRQVLPVLSGKNPVDHILGYTGHLRKSEDRDPNLPEVSNGRHLMLGKLGSGVSLPACPRSMVPPLGTFIGLVVSMCTKEQMRWVNAWGVVAPMENEQPVSDRPTVYFPRESVGPNARPDPVTDDLDFSVPVMVSGSGPNPATSNRVFRELLMEGPYPLFVGECLHGTILQKRATEVKCLGR